MSLAREVLFIIILLVSNIPILTISMSAEEYRLHGTTYIYADSMFHVEHGVIGGSGTRDEADRCLFKTGGGGG